MTRPIFLIASQKQTQMKLNFRAYIGAARNPMRRTTLSLMSRLYRMRRIIPSALDTPRVQFVYLHDIAEHEENDFRDLIAVLGKNHRFISYSEAVDRIRNNLIDAPYLSISFDDGFKSCIRATRILNEFGIKSCIFICPPIIGETDSQKVNYFCNQRLFVSHNEFLSWDDVGNIISDGHEIGGHTITHPNIAQLSIHEMEYEIGHCFKLLIEHLGQVRHFSWPFGRFHHFSARAANIVYDSGFESCASAERGCHTKATPELVKLCIRRDNLQANWPIDHILFFLARNILKPLPRNDGWPKQWHI